MSSEKPEKDTKGLSKEVKNSIKEERK